MKLAVLIALLVVGATALAAEKSEAYPVANYAFVSRAEFADLHREDSSPLLVVFSDGNCLWSTMPTRNCLLFERELDLHAEALRQRGWRVVAVDAGFRYPELLTEFDIRLRPTVRFFHAAGDVTALEPSTSVDWSAHGLTWQAELMARVLDLVD